MVSFLRYFLFLPLFLFFFPGVGPLWSASYNANDSNRLVTAGTINDPLDNLNWETNPASTTGWTGVTWEEADGENRASRINVQFRGLTGNLDLSGMTMLTYLHAWGNQLSSLDVSANTALTYLDVWSNQLSSLDVSANTALTTLWVDSNQLSSLDVSANTSLTTLDVRYNRLPLSQLAPMMHIPNLALGTQTNVTLTGFGAGVLEPGTGYDLAEEAFLLGTDTRFTLKLAGGGNAVEGVNYTLSNGVLTFLDRKNYILSMENDAIYSQGTVYGVDYSSHPLAQVSTGTLDVLPSGATLTWAGSTSEWSLSENIKSWEYNSIALNYLDGDSVIFDGKGTKAITVDAGGLSPDAMTIKADGYVFDGGDISGTSLSLEAASSSTTVFKNNVDFSSGIALSANNTLEFSYDAGAYMSDNAISGEGNLVKSGTGSLTLSGANTYTGSTRVAAGTLLLDGAASLAASSGLDLSAGSVFDISGISAAETTLKNLSGSGSFILGGKNLSLDMENNGAFSGVLSGTGGLVKKGSADLILDGENTYTGTTKVMAGPLFAGGSAANSNAKIASNLDMESGTILGGFGSIGGHVNLAPGSVLSPGKEGIGTLTVGSISFASGSVFEVEVNPLDVRSSDLLKVTGTANLNGATVKHVGLPETAGLYPAEGEWTILSAGTITGVFADNVDTDLFPFLSGELAYSSGSVTLKLFRTAEFSDFAITRNQLAVAGGMDSLDQASPVYNAVTGIIGDEDAVRLAYDGLNGEAHTGIVGAVMETDRSFAETQKRRLSSKAFDGSEVSAGAFDGGRDFWISIDGYKNTVDRTSGTAEAELKGWGASLGLDQAIYEWTAGFAFRYGDGEYKVKDRSSKMDLDSFNFGLYAGRPIGDFRVKFGAGYGFHQADSRRHVAFMGQTLKADYDIHTFQVFGELGYLKDFGCYAFEPYAGLAWNMAKNESFTEKGGSAALKAKSETNDNFTSSLGVRGYYQPVEKVKFGADINWQHLYGDKNPESRFAFTGSRNFTIEGAPMDRDSFGLGLDMDMEVAERFNVRAGYAGRFGEDSDSHAGFLTLEFSF